MDLIKILATQDIDVGLVEETTEEETIRLKREKEQKDAAEKLKVLLEIKEEKVRFSLIFYINYIKFLIIINKTN